jgi:hypothetical protein
VRRIHPLASSAVHHRSLNPRSILRCCVALPTPIANPPSSTTTLTTTTAAIPPPRHIYRSSCCRPLLLCCLSFCLEPAFTRPSARRLCSTLRECSDNDHPGNKAASQVSRRPLFPTLRPSAACAGLISLPPSSICRLFACFEAFLSRVSSEPYQTPVSRAEIHHPTSLLTPTTPWTRTVKPRLSTVLTRAHTIGSLGGVFDFNRASSFWYTLVASS